jgi:hypothetical protein
MPVKSTKPIKIFLEIVKTYWAYFMTFVAVITFIWTIGVKSERKSNEKLSVNKDIAEIKLTETEQNQKIDSLIVIISDIHKSQIEVVKNQNALRNSYVNFVSNYPGLKLKQFLEYMEGLEFQLKPINLPVDTTKQEYKINVKKIEK